MEDKNCYKKDGVMMCKSYFKVNGNEMMRESFNSFVGFLKKNGQVTGYTVNGKDVILEVDRKKFNEKTTLSNPEGFKKEEDYQKGIGEYVYYHPVNLLRNKPNISDYDEIPI